MHASTSDDRCAVHRATRVRKMHTSRRDAFQSIGIAPLGYVDYPSLDIHLSPGAVRRGSLEPSIRPDLDESCRLLYFYPGMPPSALPDAGEVHGLVLAGTGLGHVSTDWIPALKTLAEEGTMTMMTSQCLNGRVCDRVYDTGRDLLKIGVIEGADTLPEVALVKMMWVLGNEKDPEKQRLLLSSSLKGECMRRSLHGL
jgi:glutamyl-tRNA(Gln) amidotransferase subunit D